MYMYLYYDALAIGICEEISKMESAIKERRNKMSPDEARTFHNYIISMHKIYLEIDRAVQRHRRDNPGSGKGLWVTADTVPEKLINSEKILLQFFSPTRTLSESTECNSKTNATPELTSLLRKQKFYMKMIDSLEQEPTDDFEPNEAEVQSQHLNQFYEQFISNQSEITSMVDDALFDDQVEITQKVQKKVRVIQTNLKRIISPVKTIALAPALTKPSLNEHFSQTERPRVIVDFLDSQMKKQKSLIEQIEAIESKTNLEAVEAEALHGHLLQLHDMFVKNQSKIETYVSGPALDEQLRISGEILNKVTSLQVKLKGIFPPIVSQSEDSSFGEAQRKLFESHDYVNWLISKQSDLRSDIYDKIRNNSSSSRRLPVVNNLAEVEQLFEWYKLYQRKIEQLLSDSPYDLKNAKKDFDSVESSVTSYGFRFRGY